MPQDSHSSNVPVICGVSVYKPVNGRELITRKFKQLLAAVVFAAGIVLVGLYVESIIMMLSGIGLTWSVSRYGYKTIRCPYCDTSLYKHLFNEAAIWAGWVLWSKNGKKECPSCKTRFNTPV